MQNHNEAAIAFYAKMMDEYQYSNITTSTTTLVKDGKGTLKSVTINSLGTIVSTITIYDNTTGTGTKIATINSLSLSGTFLYDVNFTNGLTIVTTGTIAPNVTVSYK